MAKLFENEKNAFSAKADTLFESMTGGADNTRPSQTSDGPGEVLAMDSMLAFMAEDMHGVSAKSEQITQEKKTNQKIQVAVLDRQHMANKQLGC